MGRLHVTSFTCYVHFPLSNECKPQRCNTITKDVIHITERQGRIARGHIPM